MTSLVGVSSAVRAKLESQAKQLKGTLIVTLHKAQHLKHTSLSGSSEPFAVLRVGGVGGTPQQTFQSIVAKKGGAHPLWEQQFVFQIGAIETIPGAAKLLTSTGNESDDGALHVRLYDRNSPNGECIGRVDLNFIQLLAESDRSSTVTSHEDDVTQNTRWHKICDSKNLNEQAGWICITAEFKGTGLYAELTTTTSTGTTTNADVNTTRPSRSSDGTYVIPASPTPPTTLSTSTLLFPSSSSRPSTATVPLLSPATSNPSSAYYQSPSDAWPTPRLQPPAPGYPIVTNTATLESGAGTERRPTTAAATAIPSALSPPRTASSSSSSNRKSVSWPIHAVSFADGTTTSTNDDDKSNQNAAIYPAASSFDQPVYEPSTNMVSLITSYDIRHPGHILQLQSSALSGKFICVACGLEGYGINWNCIVGCKEFYLHEGCIIEEEESNVNNNIPAMKFETIEGEDEDEAEERVIAALSSPSRIHRPDMHCDPRHTHPLTFMPSLYEGSYLCNGCGGGGSGPAWHCTACIWDLHPECAR